MEYAFITGMGRSGTKFLATLLNCAKNAEAAHEKIGNREYWLLSWYIGGDYSLPYLEEEKEKIEKVCNSRLFIDVNGYLHHSADVLSRVFNTQAIYHLVRDPRKVVPSIMNRRCDADMQILPKKSDDIKRWMHASKFEQVCMNWRDTTEQLLSKGYELLVFEKIISNYEYVEEKLIKPLGLALSKKDWETLKGIKVNKTPSTMRRYIYAKVKGKKIVSNPVGQYHAWPDEYRRIFSEICEPYRKRIGFV